MWKKLVYGLKQTDEGIRSRQLANLFKDTILVACRAPDRRLWTRNRTPDL